MNEIMIRARVGLASSNEVPNETNSPLSSFVHTPLGPLKSEIPAAVDI